MSEKTEEPTPKRIRDPRNKSNIAKNQEWMSTIVVIGIFCYVGMAWDKHIDNRSELIVIPTQFIGVCRIGDSAGHVLWGVLGKMSGIIIPPVFMVGLMGPIANFAQVGLLFPTQIIQPSLSKINPLSKALQMFSMIHLVELPKSTMKILFLGFLFFS
jgi:type III secretion protein U